MSTPLPLDIPQAGCLYPSPSFSVSGLIPLSIPSLSCYIESGWILSGAGGALALGQGGREKRGVTSMEADGEAVYLVSCSETGGRGGK